MGNTRVIIPTQATGVPDTDAMQTNELRKVGEKLYLKFTDTELRDLFVTDTTPTNAGTTSISSDYTVLLTDGTIDITGTGIKKVTLPVASTCTDQIFYITNSSDAGCSIDPDGTETINGATVQLVQIDQGYTIKSDGSNWDILNVVTL